MILYCSNITSQILDISFQGQCKQVGTEGVGQQDIWVHKK